MQLTRIWGLMWKKGISIIPKCVTMPRTKEPLFSIVGKLSVRNWHMGWLEKSKERRSIFGYPSFVATRSSNVGIWIIVAIIYEFLVMPKKHPKTLKWKLELDHDNIHVPSGDKGN